MKKHTILYVLILFLALANGYFLFNQFGGKEKRGHRGDRKSPMEYIIKKLEFNEAQVAQLEEINIEHKEKVGIISKETRVLKEQLFKGVFTDEINQTQLDSLLEKIGDKTEDRDSEFFFHFRAIKEICNDTQIKKFEKMLKNIMDKRSKRGGSSTKHSF